MDIKIFEDQTGLMMFPEKSLDKTSSKNMDVVKLFDNKIDLRIINREDSLEITCYLLVHRGQERAIGCYIVGKDKYTDRTFGNFKKDANDALRNIGFEHHHNNEENVVFDHIGKFDIDGQSHKDIDLIVEAKNSGERVGYKGGDIGEIAVLCRQVLKKISSIDIVISTVENNMGHINVIRSKIHDERLSPTSQGKQALDRQIRKAEQRRVEEQKKLEIERMRKLKEDEDRKKEEYRLAEENRKLEEEKNKQKEREIVDNKVGQGTALVKEGLDIKRKAGYSDLEVDSDIRIMNDVINGKLAYFPSDEIEKNENEKNGNDHLDEDGRRKKEEKIKQGKIGNDKIKEGAFLLKDALISKRKDGCSDIEINSDTRIKNSGIIIKSYVSPDENKKYYKYDTDDKSDDEKRYIFGIFPDMKLIHVVIIVIVLIVVIALLLTGRKSMPTDITNNALYQGVNAALYEYFKVSI